MDGTKPYEFIGFGAMDVTKPYEFIGFGAMDDTQRRDRGRNQADGGPIIGSHPGSGSPAKPGRIKQVPAVLKVIIFFCVFLFALGRAWREPPLSVRGGAGRCAA